MSDELLRAREALTARLNLAVCDGCDGCGLRCVDGVEVARAEFEAVREFLQTTPPEELQRVLQEEKELAWGEGTVRACPFRDRAGGRCFIYPVRPLICRLFGFVEWLPCPLGQVSETLPDAVEIMQWYSQFERKTFGEWLDH